MEKIVSNDIPCEKCPLEFGNKVLLNMHMGLVHKDEAKTSNKEKIVKLENENNMLRKQTLPSVDTNKTTSKDVGSLQTKSLHGVKKPQICPICGRNFSKKGNLNIHTKSVHEEQKPHKY